MSTVKANRVQLGQSGTATQNFTLDATAADGTMKLARGNAGATTQDIMTVNALGEVDFPQLIRLYGANGYLKLPGGLIIQWGMKSASFTALTFTVVTLPIAFPTGVLGILSGGADNGSQASSTTGSTTNGASLTSINVWVGVTGNSGVRWLAIGY